MNTVKHLKNSNLPQWPRRRFLFNIASYFPAILLASWLGTYLDLYFVGEKFYEFPLRPFPGVFSINIAFTLLGLPFLTWAFLFLMNKMDRWKRWMFILLLSLAFPAVEKLSEQWGAFRHSDKWSHSYSLCGYFLFLVIVWQVFKWTNRRNNSKVK
ncbi:hypothetical protein F9802_13950 [Bacillus aerolatus]|uniref:Uncharacterized protein n=1 Tax=Bacillus aerolatus TaxID=2653354 RepID=A0A6I1FIB2_9BACI|nr:hypothetical protein F9802_13950 [Bacillus aerolatus]